MHLWCPLFCSDLLDCASKSISSGVVCSVSTQVSTKLQARRWLLTMGLFSRLKLLILDLSKLHFCFEAPLSLSHVSCFEIQIPRTKMVAFSIAAMMQMPGQSIGEPQMQRLGVMHGCAETTSDEEFKLLTGLCDLTVHVHEICH